jgi:dihydroorotase
MFTAHAALELYAEAFDSAGGLDRLEGFASHFGADFYGLPRNKDTVSLVKDKWMAPATYPFGTGSLVPYRAGESIGWRHAT